MRALTDHDTVFPNVSFFQQPFESLHDERTLLCATTIVLRNREQRVAMTEPNLKAAAGVTIVVTAHKNE